MLEKIKRDLAENYHNDEQVLNDILEEVVAIALSISNKKNTDGIESYIIKCVKAEYLSRGGEGLKGLNEAGKSSTFEDNISKMRTDIIKDGNRHIR